MEAPIITQIPGSYYFLPYFAKFQFPFYSPGGDQPILNIHKISKDLLIIMIHSMTDPQLSYEGAEAIYSGFRLCGNDSTYIMPISIYGHVLLLSQQETKHERNVLHHVLKEHNLPYWEGFTKEYANLKDYQPRVDKKAYNVLWTKDMVSKVINYGVSIYVSWMMAQNMYAYGQSFFGY